MEHTSIQNRAGADCTIEPPEDLKSGYEALVEQKEQGTCALYILVQGIYCAACIQKIETALQAHPAITKARLNFSTHRLLMEWDGAPILANEFVQIVEQQGYTTRPYDSEAEQNTSKSEERFLLLCLGVAGFAMGNVMLLSVGLWSTSAETMGIATRDLMHWVSAIIALPTILFSARPFFRSAFNALKAGQANMDVPISLALILASAMSLFETINHGEHAYFDSAVMLVFFLLIGRYLDFRARRNARSTATDLLSSMSGFANVKDGNSYKRYPVRELKEGMQLAIAVGEKFPVDGKVIEGQSDIDTALVTGETIPRTAQLGTEIYAGTINLSAPLIIETQKPAENSLLADIVKLMEQAEQGQARYVRLADRAARLYTPVIHTVAALAFFGWWLLGAMLWQDAMMIAVTVLIITCPCALGLAVPVVQVLASGRLMKQGILVKAGDALERLAQINTILLDKTGTLTLGKPKMIQEEQHKTHLQQAASLAAHSTHPLSKALSQAYSGELLELHDIKEHPGSGIEAQIDGKTVRLGSRAWCGDEQAKARPECLELWLANENKAMPTPFYFVDHMREDVPQVLARFQYDKIQPVLLSGDRIEAVEYLAHQTKIEEYHGAKTPQEKFQTLERKKEQGGNILMVGDGLNDAPSLAAANISIAPGTAIDIAQNAADIVFMGDKFMPVYEAYKTARFSQSLIRQNFMLAILYNIVAIPLALTGMVTPFIAALAMSGSSLIVIANSFRMTAGAKEINKS